VVYSRRHNTMLAQDDYLAMWVLGDGDCVMQLHPLSDSLNGQRLSIVERSSALDSPQTWVWGATRNSFRSCSMVISAYHCSTPHSGLNRSKCRSPGVTRSADATASMTGSNNHFSRRLGTQTPCPGDAACFVQQDLDFCGARSSLVLGRAMA
jgi:hypothetical protein